MHQVFFSIRLRRFTQIFFIAACTYFAFMMAASASDRCPAQDDHELSAIRYQLFAAYQTGHGGYEAPCELKCFGNETCQSKCQSQKGLEYLSAQMDKIKNKKGISRCPSISIICLEQCSQDGPACAEVCQSAV